MARLLPKLVGVRVFFIPLLSKAASDNDDDDGVYDFWITRCWSVGWCVYGFQVLAHFLELQAFSQNLGQLRVDDPAQKNTKIETVPDSRQLGICIIVNYVTINIAFHLTLREEAVQLAFATGSSSCWSAST